MNALVFANNATSRLAFDTDPASTTLTVLTGEGARFPNPIDGDFFLVTIEDRRTGQIEICKCTTRNGDALVVVRGQEGLSAQTFKVGATVSNRITANTIQTLFDTATNLGGYTREEADAKFVELTGDAMTGFLSLSGDPLSSLHATPKSYVDSGLSGKAETLHTHEIVDVINLPAELSARPVDAPQDGKIYGRGDLIWTEISAGIADAPADGGQYARYMNGWIGVNWTGITGKPASFPPSAHTHPIAEVTNLQPALDGKEPSLPAGGTTSTFLRGDKTWAVPAGGSGGGLPEAPTDGQLYSRRGADGSWQISPISGGGSALTDGDKGDIVVSASGASWMLDATVVTPAARSVLDDTSVDAMRTTLVAAAAVHTHAQADITNLVSDLTLKAPLDSPAFIGVPSAPTPTPGDNTMRVATTAFVTTGLGGKANTTHGHAQADITNLVSDLAGKAPLVSPTFSGTPAAPTPTAGDSTTRLATTAFVTGGLAGALAGKANVVHTHAQADVTNLVSDLAAKEPLLPAGGTTANFLRGDKTWRAVPPMIGLVDVGTTPPGAPIDQQLWWNSGDATLYLRYNDGSSTQWVEVSAVGLGDAPVNSQFYGRTNGAWVEGLPINGGRLIGPLSIGVAPQVNYAIQVNAAVGLGTLGAIYGSNGTHYAILGDRTNNRAITAVGPIELNGAVNMPGTLALGGAGTFTSTLTVTSTLTATAKAIFQNGFDVNAGSITQFGSGNILSVGTYNLSASAGAAAIGIDTGYIIRKTAASSRLIKQNIVGMSDADADKLLRVDPVQFRYNPAKVESDGSKNFGFVAEDLMVIDPAFTNRLKGEDLNVEIRAVVAALVSIVKRQQARIEALEAA